MKKVLFVVLPLLLSCSMDDIHESSSTAEKYSDEAGAELIDGMLRFSSLNELANTMEGLKAGKEFVMNGIPATRSESGDYTSLRQHLIEQGLREFTDTELELIRSEGLIYEPEDSIIADSEMCALLNKDREIMIGESVYRFVEDGLVEYNLEMRSRIDDIALDNVVPKSLKHGQYVKVCEDVTFTKIDYLDPIKIASDSKIQGGGSGYTTDPPQETVTPIKYNDGELKLDDGTVIPSEKIRTVAYVKGNGDANWLQKKISNAFGTNVIAISEFNSKHRMKLRMYSQDYIIYRSVGMTVRMQKKRLGIWWRTKADEFRYGWSNIECEYNFKKSVFTDNVPTFENARPVSKYPVALIKKFPYKNDKIVLFNVANYDVTTGDINKLYAVTMNGLANTIKRWIDKNKEYAGNPRGLYTALDDGRKVIVVYPQGEDIARDTGREKVEWDHNWFSGNFIVSFGYNMSTGKFNNTSLDISQALEVLIKRGCIYAAVKYEGDWRACVIKTN